MVAKDGLFQNAHINSNFEHTSGHELQYSHACFAQTINCPSKTRAANTILIGRFDPGPVLIWPIVSNRETLA